MFIEKLAQTCETMLLQFDAVLSLDDVEVGSKLFSLMLYTDSYLVVLSSEVSSRARQGLNFVPMAFTPPPSKKEGRGNEVFLVHW